jgi:hypothetical protein
MYKLSINEQVRIIVLDGSVYLLSFAVIQLLAAIDHYTNPTSTTAFKQSFHLTDPREWRFHGRRTV